MSELAGLISQLNAWLEQNPTPWLDTLWLTCWFELSGDGVLRVVYWPGRGDHVWYKAVGAGEWQAFLELVSEWPQVLKS